MIIRDNFCTFCIKTCWYPSSDEGPQHMVSMRNKKKYYQITPLARALSITSKLNFYAKFISTRQWQWRRYLFYFLFILFTQNFKRVTHLAKK